jgi:excisionase family DNA binding protein
MEDDDVMTLEEVAAYLKLPTSSVYRLTAARAIPHFKIGQRLRFSRSAVKAWRDAQSVPMREASATSTTEVRPNGRERQDARSIPPE